MPDDYGTLFEQRFKPQPAIQIQSLQSEMPSQIQLESPADFFDLQSAPVDDELYKPERDRWLQTYSQSASQHRDDNLEQYVDWASNLKDPVTGEQLVYEQIMPFVQKTAKQYLSKKQQQELEKINYEREFEAKKQKAIREAKELAGSGFEMKKGEIVPIEKVGLDKWQHNLQERFDLKTRQLAYAPEGTVIAVKSEEGMYDENPKLYLVPESATQDSRDEDAKFKKFVMPMEGGTVEQSAPATPQRAKTARDVQALEWAQANPNDPRSQAIIQALR